MNKYQEALDWLMDGNDSCGTEWDLLQELVDKATPMKPTPYIKNIGTCKSCEDSVHRLDNYCPNCGQKIDWSEE